MLALSRRDVYRAPSRSSGTSSRQDAPLIVRPPPSLGEEWAVASHRWQDGTLVPFEKVVALLALSQFFRTGLNLSGLWDRVHNYTAKFRFRARQKISPAQAQPRTYFHAIDRGLGQPAVIVPDPVLADFLAGLPAPATSSS